MRWVAHVLTTHCNDDQSSESGIQRWKPGAQNTVLRRHIDSVLITRCMKDAGFTEFEECTDNCAPLPENLAGDKTRPMFNESLAAQYGYRRAPHPRITNQEERVAAGVDLYAGASAEFHDQWDICSAEAQWLVDERMNIAA